MQKSEISGQRSEVESQQSEKTRLFCWSGGGLPGLDIHIGIWLGLSEAGIFSDANAGTSAGALVGAMNSDGCSAGTASQKLRELCDWQVCKKRFAWPLRIRRIDSFLKHAPIVELLKELLPPNFSSLEKEFAAWVTNDRTGIGGGVSDGNLREAVLASMSIAGVFPSVRIGSNDYSDGGSCATLPLPSDINSFDEVWLLCAKRPLAYKRKKSVITRLMYNADLLFEDQVNRTIAEAKRRHSCVRVIRPILDAPKGTLHFDHSLIGDAFIQTRNILKDKGWS